MSEAEAIDSETGTRKTPTVTRAPRTGRPCQRSPFRSAEGLLWNFATVVLHHLPHRRTGHDAAMHVLRVVSVRELHGLSSGVPAEYTWQCSIPEVQLLSDRIKEIADLLPGERVTPVPSPSPIECNQPSARGPEGLRRQEIL